MRVLGSIGVLFLSSFLLTGCGDTVQFLAHEGLPSHDQAFSGYSQIQLNESDSAEVLELFYLPEYELLSQSKSVIAACGEKKWKGYRVWFKMAGFDEDELSVKRKYFFEEDERPKNLFIDPWEQLKFDCEVILPAEITEQPYANDNARTIAILHYVFESFAKDSDQVKLDNKRINISKMMVNQAFETVNIILKESPALAKRLSDEDGIKFDHMNLDKGRIRLGVFENIAIVKMRLGASVKKLIGDGM